jgi:hypothetical protein
MQQVPAVFGDNVVCFCLLNELEDKVSPTSELARMSTAPDGRETGWRAELVCGESEN